MRQKVKNANKKANVSTFKIIYYAYTTPFKSILCLNYTKLLVEVKLCCFEEDISNRYDLTYLKVA